MNDTCTHTHTHKLYKNDKLYSLTSLQPKSMEEAKHSNTIYR